MYLPSLSKDTGVFAILAFLIFGIPGNGVSGEKCKCQQISDYIIEKEQQCKAWEEIVKEMKWEPNLPFNTQAAIDEVKKKFRDKMKKQFPNRDFEKVGELDANGDPVLLDGQRCDEIEESTKKHEEDHKNYLDKFGFFKQQWAKWWTAEKYAEFEMQAYKEQVKILESIKRQICSKAELELSVGMAPEEMYARRERIKRAAERIAAYASAII